TALALLFLSACLPAPDGHELGETEEAAAAMPADGGLLDEDFDGLRWKDGVVHYVIDVDNSWPSPGPCAADGVPVDATAWQDYIRQALDEYNQLTPVQFVENTRDNPPPAGHSYIIYRATDDGASNAMIRGMPRDGVTPNCVYIRSSAQYKW